MIFKQNNTRKETHAEKNSDSAEIARDGDSIYSDTIPVIEGERISPVATVESSQYHESGLSPGSDLAGIDSSLKCSFHDQTSVSRISESSDHSGEDSEDDDNKSLDSVSQQYALPHVFDNANFREHMELQDRTLD